MNLTAYPQLQSALEQNKNIVYLCGADYQWLLEVIDIAGITG